ncbi:hypothetical protein cyc_04479 [Cyclospora cayetanensis]|uniref:Uncharacterized protein n=1 Tax=Cyclospora cayetanensis TaxID=88456 RepID=A0A1D3D0B6_9EIME|nr:hypothetical protein cyc_04479 [Cyclospora cayetanensis]
MCRIFLGVRLLDTLCLLFSPAPATSSTGALRLLSLLRCLTYLAAPQPLKHCICERHTHTQESPASGGALVPFACFAPASTNALGNTVRLPLMAPSVHGESAFFCFRQEQQQYPLHLAGVGQLMDGDEDERHHTRAPMGSMLEKDEGSSKGMRLAATEVEEMSELGMLLARDDADKDSDEVAVDAQQTVPSLAATCCWQLKGSRVERFGYDKASGTFRWSLLAPNLLLLQHLQQRQQQHSKARPLANKKEGRAHGQQKQQAEEHNITHASREQHHRHLGRHRQQQQQPSYHPHHTNKNSQRQQQAPPHHAVTAAAVAACTEEVIFAASAATVAYDWLQLMERCCYLGSPAAVYLHSSSYAVFPSTPLEGLPAWLFLAGWLSLAATRRQHKRLAAAAAPESQRQLHVQQAMLEQRDAQPVATWHSPTPPPLGDVGAAAGRANAAATASAATKAATGNQTYVSLRLLALHDVLLPEGYGVYCLVEYQSSVSFFSVYAGRSVAPTAAAAAGEANAGETGAGMSRQPQHQSLLHVPKQQHQQAGAVPSPSLFSKWFGRASAMPAPSFCRRLLLLLPPCCVNLPVFFPRPQEDLILHFIAAPLEEQQQQQHFPVSSTPEGRGGITQRALDGSLGASASLSGQSFLAAVSEAPATYKPEVFDIPQPFAHIALAPGEGAAADAGALAPLQLLGLQLKRLQRIHRRMAAAMQQLGCLFEFGSPAAALWMQRLQLVALLSAGGGSLRPLAMQLLSATASQCVSCTAAVQQQTKRGEERLLLSERASQSAAALYTSPGAALKMTTEAAPEAAEAAPEAAEAAPEAAEAAPEATEAAPEAAEAALEVEAGKEGVGRSGLIACHLIEAQSRTPTGDFKGSCFFPIAEGAAGEGQEPLQQQPQSEAEAAAAGFVVELSKRTDASGWTYGDSLKGPWLAKEAPSTDVRRRTANQLAITSRRGYNQQHSGAAIAAAPSRGSATLGEFNEDLRRAATAAERCETEGALSSMSNDETAAADRAHTEKQGIATPTNSTAAVFGGASAADDVAAATKDDVPATVDSASAAENDASAAENDAASAADDPADVAANDTIPADGNTCDAADTAAAAGDGIGAPSEHMVTVHECSSAAATCTATAAGDDIAAPADGRFTASDATDATEDGKGAADETPDDAAETSAAAEGNAATAANGNASTAAGDTAAAAPTSTLTAAAAARENSSQADDSTHVLADDSAPLTAGADKTAAPHAHAGEAPCKAKEHNKTTALTQTASTAAAVADRLVDAGESACQSNSTAAHTLREQVNVALHALSFSAASDVAAATGGAVSAGHAPAEKAASVPSSFENAGGSGSPHAASFSVRAADASDVTPPAVGSVQQVHHNHPTAPLPPCEDEGREQRQERAPEEDLVQFLHPLQRISPTSAAAIVLQQEQQLLSPQQLQDQEIERDVCRLHRAEEKLWLHHQSRQQQQRWSWQNLLHLRLHPEAPLGVIHIAVSEPSSPQ